MQCATGIQGERGSREVRRNSEKEKAEQRQPAFVSAGVEIGHVRVEIGTVPLPDEALRVLGVLVLLDRRYLAAVEPYHGVCHLRDCGVMCHDQEVAFLLAGDVAHEPQDLSLIHISEPTRLGMISYAVFCLKNKKKP